MSYQEEKEYILMLITPWTVNETEAETWFHQQYIPALGCTANEALSNGHFDALNNYLSIIEVGGYA
ncbi:hypothetical protein [Alteromonas sp. RKMC-009]|uniref:hypothetical protein n=1 Tax=Alteromonas sp. RKMC-009 TaxID=2267264 RepID=UPI000F0C0299|nr:hypothetical protein [Alteromonas sp. RKMC-009]AYN07608.1 hypothetical protein DS731_21660 [Alteromonas sp. RKMC-009]